MIELKITRTMTKKIKIANIACAFPPYAGGMAGSAKQVEELLSPKFIVDSFHPDNTKPLFQRGHGAFIPSLFLKLKHYDYIYLHYPFFGTAEVVWFYKLFFPKTKLIIHYHMEVKHLSFGHKILTLPSRLILKSLLNKAETIVTASLDYIANSPLKDYQEKHLEKFKEIVFGLDLNKFKPKEIDQPGGEGLIAKTKAFINYINDNYIKKDKTEFIFVAALDSAHYFKGLSNLLKALSLSSGNWRLSVVGDGNLKASYQKEAYLLGLEKKVIFKGRVSDSELIRSYQESDCLILPSINGNEAFGIVIIEAMACGLAVIASDLAGVRKVFEDKKQGFLVEPGNIQDLKEKIEKIVADKNLRKEMSLSARELSEKKYSVNMMKEKLESLFINPQK